MKTNLKDVLKQIPMAHIVIGIIIGLLSEKYFTISVSSVLIPIGILTILIMRWKWKNSYIVIFLLSIIIGYAVHYSKNHEFSNSVIEANKIDGQNVVYKGIIQDITVFSTEQRYVLENLLITFENETLESKFRYIVYPAENYSVAIGDTIIGKGKFGLYGRIRNLGEFDFKKYYHNQHVVGRIYSKEIINHYPRINWSFNSSLNSLRETIRKKLTAYSDVETAALFSALIVGDRTKIDQDLRESFANVGVVHVLAVSGLHVGYVMLILIVLVRTLRIRWGWDKIAIILGLIAFSLISGGRPSVVRASIMAGLYIMAPIFNRRANAWNIVASAAFIILIFDPNSIYDLGFQLSFTAVISIVYFYSIFNKILPEFLRPTNIKSDIARFFWTLFLISLSAQIGTIPITAYYFDRIPLIAVIANLIVIPLIGIFVALGFIKLLFFWIPPLSYFFDQMSWLVKETIYDSIALFDKFPFASLATPQFDILSLSVYISILLIVFSLIKWQISRILIFGSILLNLIIWPKVLVKDGLDIVFLDLGTNESAIIKNNNSSVLINNGVHSMFSNNIDRTILPVLKYLKIRELDHFIRPYGNSNYKVGTVKLSEKMPINNFWDVGFDSTSSFDSYLVNLLDIKGIEYNRIVRGDVLQIDEQTYIQFLLPLHATNAKNNYALRLTNKNNTFLILDQLTAEECRLLLENNDVLKSDILKISYPKKLTDELQDLINAIDPDIMVVTGRRISKHNPTIEEILKIGPLKIILTEVEGAVWLNSSNKNIEVRNWR